MVACGTDTYSEGLLGQTVCNACPPGTHTDPDAIAGAYNSSAACLAGPGYWMAPGGAVPCAAGSFKAGFTGPGENCTSCAAARGAGLTTAAAGAESAAECTVLAPGYAAVGAHGLVLTTAAADLAAVVRAKPCPQGWTCPGGDPRSDGVPQRCPHNLLTQAEGASDASQCQAPPGHYYTGSSMLECSTGFYKTGWDRASSCTPCGTAAAASDSNAGWMSGRIVRVPRFDRHSGAAVAPLLVRGNSSSCCECQQEPCAASAAAACLLAVAAEHATE